MIVDNHTGRLVWAAKGHGKAVRTTFFDALGPDRAARLELVPADGAGTADGRVAIVVKQRAPQAVRCIDPYHVVAWAGEALDEVRRSTARALAASGNAAGLELVKGSRWALLKSPGTLTGAQGDILAAPVPVPAGLPRSSRPPWKLPHFGQLTDDQDPSRPRPIAIRCGEQEYLGSDCSWGAVMTHTACAAGVRGFVRRSRRGAPGRPWKRVTAAIVVLAVAFAVAPAGPAAASSSRCREVDVPFSVAGQSATMHGTLCLPRRHASTVVVLVPGGTYNHVYWDFPLQPGRYSFRRGLNQAGLATFVVDRLGTGRSWRPASTEVTAAAQAAAIHAVVQWLRAAGPGRRPFAKVVVGGHSLGSVLVIGAVATYPGDADGVLITGFTHNIDPETLALVNASFHPAPLDPAFAGAQPPYDAGYLTTRPGTRYRAFYAPARADPRVVALDEATKDVLSVTESQTASPIVADPSLTRSIQVPVLTVHGELDSLFVCGPAGPPCTTEALRAQEGPYYSPDACLQAFVLPAAGHSLNLFPTAPHAWSAVAGWVDEFVAGHRQRGNARHPASCPQPSR